MTKKEFNKGINESRKMIGKQFGFRRNGYISYKVVNDYFFCIFHCVDSEVTLKVKPMYLDDLWWDVFQMSDNKKRISLRGNGAFALFGERIGEYPTFVDNWRNYSEQDFEKIWIDVFKKVEEKIKNFLSQNPSADLFMVPPARNPDYIPLEYLISLLHNHKYKEVIELVHKAREVKSPCFFTRWDDGVEKDSYSFILDYAKSHLVDKS